MGDSTYHLAVGESAGQSGSTPASQLTGRHHAHHPPDPQPDSHRITLEAANDDSPAYLIHEYASEEFESWLEGYYVQLFENILGEWYTESALWPQDRSLKRLKAWCDLEVHSMVLDCVDEPLLDDEIE